MKECYDTTLPSKAPFMFIEEERVIPLGDDDAVRLISYGAFNAGGLIGPEQGGVAVVHDDPNFVIASKAFPHDAARRKIEMVGLANLLEKRIDVSESLIEIRRSVFMALRSREYLMRHFE